MKLREASIIIIIVVVAIAAGIGYISSYCLGMKPDNQIEEAMEVIITDQTGIEIDLTPEDETGGFIQNVNIETIKKYLTPSSPE